MLKPSDVTARTTCSVHDTMERAAIEAHIDRSLENARYLPHVVPSTRSGWRSRNIEAVLKAYEALGWVVEPRYGGCLARFSHPTSLPGSCVGTSWPER